MARGLAPVGLQSSPKIPQPLQNPVARKLAPVGLRSSPKIPQPLQNPVARGLAPVGLRSSPKISRPTKNPVARELAPAGLRSSPKTSIPDSSGKPQRLVSRLLRSRTGASSLATKALRCYSGDRARNRRPITSSTSHPSRNGMAQSKAKSLRMKDSQSIEPRMERFSST